MTRRTISRSLGALGALLLLACAESHSPLRDGAVATDAALVDAARPDAVMFDAAPAFDAGPPSLFPITDEQADCLGLSRPACAGCHRRPDGVFYLRPSAPPPPPGIDFDALPWASCGVMRP